MAYGFFRGLFAAVLLAVSFTVPAQPYPTRPIRLIVPFAPGSGTHLAMELLLLTNNLELVHVPYQGTGPALIALLSSEISVVLSTFAPALPYVKAGRLRALVTNTK